MYLKISPYINEIKRYPGYVALYSYYDGKKVYLGKLNKSGYILLMECNGESTFNDILERIKSKFDLDKTLLNEIIK